MTGYEILVEEISKTLREVSQYSVGKIEQILEQEPALNDEIFSAWNRLILGICYDKQYCPAWC